MDRGANAPTWAAGMLRNFLFSGGLLLTAATQLRVPGLPVGPGELMLLGWLALGVLLGSAHAETSRPGQAPVSIFWAAFIVSQSIGMVVSFASELFFDTSSVIHDIGAYCFCLAITAMLVRDLANQTHRRRLVRVILSVSLGGLLLQLLQGLGLFNVPGTEPWYFNRLQGWSENPNMLGLLSAFIVLLAVFGVEIATSRREILLSLVPGGVALLTGFMTRSDSFALSILVGGSIWLGMQTWTRLTMRSHSISSTMAALCFIFAPVFLLTAAPFAPAAISAVETYTTNMYDDNSQGETRLNLWREAVGKGMESQLLGYGPGPHLTSKSFKRPPPDKFEAHNTFLDIFTQAGLVGVLAFVVLLSVTFASAIRAGMAPLVALASGLLIFSMFHFVIRQPIFWFGLVLCLVEAQSALRPRTAESRDGNLKPHMVPQ